MKNIKDFMMAEAKASTKFGKGTFDDLGSKIASHLGQLENVNVTYDDYVKSLFDAIFENTDKTGGDKEQFINAIKTYLNL
jgi:hypothetical protein